MNHIALAIYSMPDNNVSRILFTLDAVLCLVEFRTAYDASVFTKPRAYWNLRVMRVSVSVAGFPHDDMVVEHKKLKLID